MKARGYPTYTQRSVAWPTLPPNGHEFDEINVEFDVSPTADQGCYGSGVLFLFHEFNDRSKGLEVTGWDDGFQHLLDDRIQAVLITLRKQRQRRGDHRWSPTPADVIRALERQGIGPSDHHRRGAPGGASEKGAKL